MGNGGLPPPPPQFGSAAAAAGGGAPPPVRMMGNGGPTATMHPPPPPLPQSHLRGGVVGGYPQHPPPPPLQQQQQHNALDGSHRAAHALDGSHRGGGGGYPHPPQQPEKPRIDPSQIPRPPLFTRPQQHSEPLPVYYPKAAAEANPVQPPPPADSRYTVVDDGNASPDAIRATTYAFPLDRAVWHKTGDMPIGVLCTPLLLPSPDFVPRPRVLLPPSSSAEEQQPQQAWTDPQAVAVLPDITGQPPARCGHCHAYVNPYTAADGTCNLCRTRNRNPNFVGLARQLGTVEYEVGGPYVTRHRVVETATTLYAIDLTAPRSYVQPYLEVLMQVAVDLQQHWERQQQFQMTHRQEKPRPRLGVCFFGCLGVVFQDRTTGRYVIMPDVTEQPFAPIPLENWTYDLSTPDGLADLQTWLQEELLAREVLSHWRDQNARHKCQSTIADGLELSCGGAALAFLHACLADSGGRGTVLTWRRPNFGVGALPHRAQHTRQHAAAEDPNSYIPLQLLASFRSPEEEAAAAFYKQLETACVQSRVSLDVVVHTPPAPPQMQQQAPLELATLGEFCKITSGQLIWIHSTSGDMSWLETLRAELTRPVQSFMGWDAVFKVRVSEGVEVKSFSSSSGMQVEASVLSGGSAELELSSVTPSTCIAVELEHRVGGIPKDRGLVFVQTALLYTTLAGRRRVRVSTLAIRTTSVANEVYRAVDFGAMTTILTRSATDLFRKDRTFSGSEGSVDLRSKARDLIYHRCIHILSSYRQHTPAMNSPMGQLILPEKMQLLPLFCMCLLKSPMLRPSLPRRSASSQAAVLSPTSDERAFYSYHVSQAMPCFMMLLVHPNVFAVSESLEDERIGQWQCPDEGEQVNGFVCIPPMVLPSMESMQDDGVYLIDDGVRIFLYIGKLVPDLIKHALLEGDGTAMTTPEIKQLVDALVYQMRQYSSTTRGCESELRRTSAPVVRVLQQEGHQSPAEADILNLMVADATAGDKDYVDFLCTLHRRIREQVESNRK